jgi:hypothetical protein
LSIFSNKTLFFRAISKKTLGKIKVFKALINVILKRSPFSDIQQVTRSDIHEIKKMIDSSTESFQVLTKQKIINRRQEHLNGIFASLVQMMKEVKLKEKQDNFTMFELLMKRTNNFFALMSDPTVNLEFEFEKQGEILLAGVLKLEEFFFDNIEEKSRFQAFHRWLFNNSIGTVDQVKTKENREIYWDLWFIR